MVHTALYSALICPEAAVSRERMVEIFSEGWHLQGGGVAGNARSTIGQLALDAVGMDHLGKELPRTVVVEFYGREAGRYPVMWLELAKR